MNRLGFSLVATCLATAIVLFLPAQVEIFETPKIAVTRACGIALLAWWLLRHGRRPSLPASRIELYLLLLLGIEILSTIFSVDPRLSWLGEFRQREGLLTGLGLTGVYLAVRQADSAARERWLDVILGCGALCCCYALCQAAGHDVLRWGGQSPAGSTLFIRPVGTQGHPNHLSVVLAGLLGLACSLFWDRPRRRWLTGPLALLFGLTLLLSFSRGGWLGGIAAVGAVVALHASSLKTLPHRAWAVVGTVAALACVGLVVTPWGGMLVERFGEMLQPATGSTRSRLEIWRSTWPHFRDHLWLGSGPDTFGLVFPRYQTPELWLHEWGGWPEHAHGLPLHVATTRGIGAILVLGMIAVEVFRHGRRLAASGAGAARRPAWLACLAGVFVAALFGTPTVTGMLLLLMALADLARPAGDTAPLRSRKWFVVPLIALLLSGLGLGVVEYRASYQARWAQALRDADPIGAVEYSRESLRLVDWDEYLHRTHLEALLFALRRRNTIELRDEAQAVGRELVRRWPLRAQNHQRCGTALLASVMADDETAIPEMRRCFERAAELAPWNGLFVEEQARSLRIAGVPEGGLALLVPMAEHYSSRGRLWAELAELRIEVGEMEEALRCLKRAAAGQWLEESSIRERVLRRLVEFGVRNDSESITVPAAPLPEGE